MGKLRTQVRTRTDFARISHHTARDKKQGTVEIFHRKEREVREGDR
jgi:hypothetical protein